MTDASISFAGSTALLSAIGFSADVDILYISQTNPKMRAMLSEGCALLESPMASHIDLWSESSGQCIAGLWRHYPMSEIATVLRGMPAVTLHCSHQLATKAEFDKWQDAARQFARKAAPHRASFFKFSFEPDMAQYVTDGLSCFDGLTMLLLAGGSCCGLPPRNKIILFNGASRTSRFWRICCGGGSQWPGQFYMKKSCAT